MDIGTGKYHNRNVIDMFAGIFRGREQLTVRASRQLDHNAERVGVGPLDYQVVEPLNAVRLPDLLRYHQASTVSGRMDVGRQYEIHHYLHTADDQVTYFSGFLNEADGTQLPLYSVQPHRAPPAPAPCSGRHYSGSSYLVLRHGERHPATTGGDR